MLSNIGDVSEYVHLHMLAEQRYYITSPVKNPQNINTSESLFTSVDILGNFTDGLMSVGNAMSAVSDRTCNCRIIK